MRWGEQVPELPVDRPDMLRAVKISWACVKNDLQNAESKAISRINALGT